jgi:MFS family permease
VPLKDVKNDSTKQYIPATGKAMQERSPGIFGSKGGMSRLFSMMDVSASLGTMIGPIIGGSLKQMFGYKYMSWTLGKSLISLLVGIANNDRSCISPPSCSCSVLLRSRGYR